MTDRVRKLSISLPEDVARHLDSQGKGRASAYVAEAVRRHAALEDFTREMAERGVVITEKGMDHAHARRIAAKGAWTPERRAAVEERMRQTMAEETGSGEHGRAEVA